MLLQSLLNVRRAIVVSLLLLFSATRLVDFALSDEVPLVSSFRRSRPYATVRSTVRRRPLGRPVEYYKEYGALGMPSDTRSVRCVSPRAAAL